MDKTDFDGFTKQILKGVVDKRRLSFEKQRRRSPLFSIRISTRSMSEPWECSLQSRACSSPNGNKRETKLFECG